MVWSKGLHMFWSTGCDIFLFVFLFTSSPLLASSLTLYFFFSSSLLLLLLFLSLGSSSSEILYKMEECVVPEFFSSMEKESLYWDGKNEFCIIWSLSPMAGGLHQQRHFFCRYLEELWNVLLLMRMSYAWDSWSLGVNLYVFQYGRLPFMKSQLRSDDYELRLSLLASSFFFSFCLLLLALPGLLFLLLIITLLLNQGQHYQR